MRRLFQFGTVLMLIGAFVPLLELFDHWDAPGLSNDTEYTVYAFLFLICLVLVLCKLISSAALRLGFVSWQTFLPGESAKLVETGYMSIFAVPPLFVLPLRI